MSAGRHVCLPNRFRIVDYVLPDSLRQERNLRRGVSIWGAGPDSSVGAAVLSASLSSPINLAVLAGWRGQAGPVGPTAAARTKRKRACRNRVRRKRLVKGPHSCSFA